MDKVLAYTAHIWNEYIFPNTNTQGYQREITPIIFYTHGCNRFSH